VAAPLIRRRFLALIGAVWLAACAAAPAPADDSMIRIFLVRHAEKQAGEDPALTAAGELRAAALVARLEKEGLTEVWSTQTRRTEQTAAPAASAFGLVVKAYDAGALPAFAGTLSETPGVKLVVGHSNTTDALAALLGAEPGPPISDAEFDRLYVIDVNEQWVVSSRIERYGAPLPVAEGKPE
jgi:2,3-bisphosphoglycerate-dependent phosphoglycerate mutase